SRLRLGGKRKLIIDSLSIITGLKTGDDYPVAKKLTTSETSSLTPDKMDLSQISIQYVKGVGPRIAEILSRKGIRTVEDALHYFPRTYEDRRNIKRISALKPYSRHTIMGKIILSGMVRLRSRGIYQVIISDGTGTIALLWYQYNLKYLRATYKKGSTVILSGDVSLNKYNSSLQIVHPSPDDVEVVEDIEEIKKDMLNFNRIVPIYPLTEGIKQRRIRKIESTIIDTYSKNLIDYIPYGVKKRNHIINLDEAISRVHFPSNSDDLIDLSDKSSIYGSQPHKTISFNEFFLLETGLALKKRDISTMPGISFNPTGELTQRMLFELPFKLTSAQSRVLSEIENDMKADRPMNRLLQGDVGSGKTVVALLSILKAVESGYQAVLMAPTEILAEQHLRSVLNYVDKFGIRFVLLKSAQGRNEKESNYRAISSGDAKIVIGTHALLQEKVEFRDLGLVVIDEQHRFGVIQRALLRSKGKNPDVLVMTATPIPRTLAMTVYGDLDISFLDEMPPHQQSIKTLVFFDEKGARDKAYDLVRHELSKGRQVYIVYPLIDESESPEHRDLRFATKMFDELKTEAFPDFRLGLLHGRMKTEEKNEVMNNFISHQVDILVATTVVEVGVDVPNATVMVVENSERYGLSQLHQLRGRVGRGEHESLCILISGSKRTADSQRRLSILRDTSDGFKIAEADLMIRGPGEFIGTKQSGLPEFRFASLLRDTKILEEARNEAFNIVKEDPILANYPRLYKEVLKRWGESLELAGIS
ncbi:MAG: ATP-dependent DNA helicase RecG, partial [Deltaproteobacteria bacterium]|nr:ATP-dependent DNA helicase RecG [Deltaproteobacteria bacterium]